MTDSDGIVVETASRIFADLADLQTINADRDGHWRAPLWQALTDAGLPLAWVPEEHNGAGVSLDEGFGVIGAAGRHALAVPLAETMLAGWLLAQAGIASPNGAMTVAPTDPRDVVTLAHDGTLKGRARNIPFAQRAQHLAVLATTGDNSFVIALVARADCKLMSGRNLGSDDSDRITFDGVTPIEIKPAPAGMRADALRIMGAVARSLQIAGALEGILNLTVAYANERVAFEKKISKFQAVQHNLAKLAGEAAAALAAASSAADALANAQAFDDEIFLEAASAKIRCAEAAEKGAAIAHQVLGAIGFTQEHVLHRFTLRALAWRDDFGNESQWAVDLGRMVAARGADELWPLVASR